MTNEKYLTTETDAGFRAVVYAVEQGEGYIELIPTSNIGWRRPFTKVTLDGIVNNMKRGFHYRIPNPAYKEPEDHVIDEYFRTLTPNVFKSDKGYCFTIENEDEECVAESGCFSSSDEAEEAADAKRVEIATHLARQEHY